MSWANVLLNPFKVQQPFSSKVRSSMPASLQVACGVQTQICCQILCCMLADMGNGRAEEEWGHFADVILGWALDPSSVRGPGSPSPGLFKTFSMEGEPPTPGAPTDFTDAAWENLVNSNFHRC